MGVAFTIIYTLVYIVLMDKCALCLSWFSVLVVEAALIGFGVAIYIMGQDMEDSTWATFFAVTCWVTAGCYGICLICNLKALKMSFAVIETAGDYFSQTKRILTVPVLFFFLSMIFFSFWTFSISSVGTNGEVMVDSYTSRGVTYYTQQRYIVSDGSTNSWLLAFLFFGLIWVSFFLIAANDFVIIVSTITWYFSLKTDHGEEGKSDVWKGFKWLIKFNFGTVAAGSAILSVVW
eukprot:CAMPEP_0116879394 /NCGR_PEP_ID=MMETSP0463-20121206/11199_1 /TAXON_ID=181622 /ORGANISM="Strombidinopsis sp, Strain SopsisLIS2011" /LENGTH=233 /DNA_ID=CAMNT_0004528681 /DNA_START=714 /DNA_END=1412 /DNA_ORIENTATION=-